MSHDYRDSGTGFLRERFNLRFEVGLGVRPTVGHLSRLDLGKRLEV